MSKLSFIAVLVLLVVASCTKKSAPAASKEPAMDGSPIFARNCARCHGANGRGDRGPDISRLDYTKSEVMQTIADGGGKMPPFHDKLSTKEIEAVAVFVLHLNK